MYKLTTINIIDKFNITLNRLCFLRILTIFIQRTKIRIIALVKLYFTINAIDNFINKVDMYHCIITILFYNDCLDFCHKVVEAKRKSFVQFLLELLHFFRVFSHGSGNSFHYFYYYGNTFHSGNVFHSWKVFLKWKVFPSRNLLQKPINDTGCFFVCRFV